MSNLVLFFSRGLLRTIPARVRFLIFLSLLKVLT